MNKHNPNDSCATIRCSTKRCGAKSSSFGDDLVIEILSKLPPKSLLRFMCVSKSWRNLISNSLTSSPVSDLLYRNSFWPLRKMGNIHFSGCYNGNCGEAIESWVASLKTFGVYLTKGLFLLYNGRDVPAAYHICNPATKQCVALPEPPLDPSFKPTYMSLSALAFNPQESPHYKVVRFSVPRLFHHRRNYEDPEYVDIFSSKDRRWIDCNVSTGRNIGTFWATISSEDFVFVNGALHLILTCNSLYSFDVKKMFSRTVKLPKGEKSHWDKCIGKSEGRLLFCAYDGFMIYIWMLQNFETGEWVLKHTCPGDTIEKHPAAFHSEASRL